MFLRFCLLTVGKFRFSLLTFCGRESALPVWLWECCGFKRIPLDVSYFSQMLGCMLLLYPNLGQVEKWNIKLTVKTCLIINFSVFPY